MRIAEKVAKRLLALIEEIALSGVVLEMNAGGIIPIEDILSPLKWFGEHLVPTLR